MLRRVLKILRTFISVFRQIALCVFLFLSGIFPFLSQSHSPLCPFRKQVKSARLKSKNPSKAIHRTRLSVFLLCKNRHKELKSQCLKPNILQESQQLFARLPCLLSEIRVYSQESRHKERYYTAHHNEYEEMPVA